MREKFVWACCYLGCYAGSQLDTCRFVKEVSSLPSACFCKPQFSWINKVLFFKNGQLKSKCPMQEKIKHMYRSMGYLLPEDEVETGDKTSDEPIDVDTVESDESHAHPLPKKKSSKRLVGSAYNVLDYRPDLYQRFSIFCTKNISDKLGGGVVLLVLIKFLNLPQRSSDNSSDITYFDHEAFLCVDVQVLFLCSSLNVH